MKKLYLPLIFALLISSCGQKGPLYLPDEENSQSPQSTQSHSPYR